MDPYLHSQSQMDEAAMLMLLNMLQSPLMSIKDSLSVSVDDKPSSVSQNGRQIFSVQSSAQSTIELVKKLFKFKNYTGSDLRPRILSPRIMPLYEQAPELRFASPDLFSLYSSKSIDSIIPLPHLFRALGFNDEESKNMIKIIRQSVLSNEILASVTSPIKFRRGRRHSSSSSSFSRLDFRQRKIFVENSNNLVEVQHLLEISTSSKTLGAVYQLFSAWQMGKLNEKGYWFLNCHQLSYIYGDQMHNESFVRFNATRYISLNCAEKQNTVFLRIIFLFKAK